MNRIFAIGAALTALGVAGYTLGIVSAYPGRAFSVTAVMVGVATLAVGYGDGSGNRDMNGNRETNMNGTENGDGDRNGGASP